MPRVKFDETFLEMTLEDIKDSIERVARSRAKAPKPIATQIAYLDQRITITVERKTLGRDAPNRNTA